MASGFSEFDRPVNAGDLPLACLDWARRTACRTSRFRFAIGGDLPNGTLLNFATQLTPQRHRLAFNNAVMRRLKKHALFDLFLNRNLCQRAQKSLLFLLARFLTGIHA